MQQLKSFSHLLINRFILSGIVPIPLLIMHNPVLEPIRIIHFIGECIKQLLNFGCIMSCTAGALHKELKACPTHRTLEIRGVNNTFLPLQLSRLSSSWCHSASFIPIWRCDVGVSDWRVISAICFPELRWCQIWYLENVPFCHFGWFWAKWFRNIR